MKKIQYIPGVLVQKKTILKYSDTENTFLLRKEIGIRTGAVPGKKITRMNFSLL